MTRKPHQRIAFAAVAAVAGALLFTGVASASSGLVTVSNDDGITINDNTTATPFPSSVLVSGGTVAGATVTLEGFQHSFLADLEIWLVGPGGQRVTLVDNQGGGGNVCGTYTFANGAAAFPSSSATATPGLCSGSLGWASGTYGPFSSFDALIGAVANGTWSLYVDDQAGADVGSISRWILQLLAQLPTRAGYCSVAGNTHPYTGAAIAPGTFLNLTIEQIATDPSYQGVKPANYVEGLGITCDPPPAGYTQDGFAPESLGVPAKTYPFFKKS